MLRALLILVLLSPSMAATAARNSLPDLLDTAAERSARVLGGLITDITRAGNRLVAVGAYGAIIYSDDNGASWVQAQVPVQVTLTAVTFVDASLGWAVGHDGLILHTEDGGASWTRQLDGRQTGELLLATSKPLLAELETQADADFEQLDRVMMAVDEAQREQDIGPNRPLLDVWFRDQNHGVAIGAFGYFFVTDDGGITWRDASLELPNPESLHLYSIAKVNGSTLLVVGEFGLLLRSPDLGQSWESVELDYEGTLFSVSGSDKVAWIAGLRGNAFYSNDAGITWERVNTNTQATLLSALVVAPGEAMLVGVGGTVLRANSLTREAFPMTQPLGSHLAVGAMTGDSWIVGGMSGLQRFNAKGQPQPVAFSEGATP
jgi:photosystem II stability/assembly factor-like uncharacterized protein